MPKEPDPSDKRQNLLKVIQEQNGKYTENELSVFFMLASFKEWLSAAKTITEENQISLRENLVTDAEMTPEAIYDKHFLGENQNSSVIVPSPSHSPTVESSPKKTDNRKIVQFPQITSAYDALKTFFSKPFLQGDALDRIKKTCGIDQAEAERIYLGLVDDGKLAITPEGFWWFV
jgi:hypothetical protein